MTTAGSLPLTAAPHDWLALERISEHGPRGREADTARTARQTDPTREGDEHE